MNGAQYSTANPLGTLSSTSSHAPISAGGCVARPPRDTTSIQTNPGASDGRWESPDSLCFRLTRSPLVKRYRCTPDAGNASTNLYPGPM